jgi:tetratricopeptide (TPR) repeat protein
MNTMGGRGWGQRESEFADPRTVAAEILRISALGKLTLFVGSFVSARSPSGLPMAAELKQAVLTSLWHGCRRQLNPVLAGSPSTLLRGSEWSALPLEMVIEEILAATDIPVGKLLSFVDRAAPNYNHAVLARLLDEGSTQVVTTNFDEAIEKVWSTPDSRRNLSKPHGTISDPEEVAIRLTQIGRRIPSVKQRKDLEKALRGRDICFVGYSGRDLDIQPVLRSTSIRSVLWITKPPSARESAAATRERQRLQELFGPGTPVRCVAVDADEVFDAVGKALSVLAAPPGKSSPWRRILATTLNAAPWNRQASAVGRILRLSGRPALAADVYGVLESAPLPQLDIATAMLNRAAAFYRRQEFSEAQEAARRAISAFRRLDNAEGLAGSYGFLALILERSSERVSGWALRYLRMSVDLYPSRRSRAALGARLDLGVWLKNRGQFEQAEQTFVDGLHDARASGDLDAQMGFQMCLGILRGTERHEALVAGDSAASCRLARSARYHLRRSRASAGFLANKADELRAVSALIALDLDRSLRRPRLAVAADLLDEAERLAGQSPEPDQRWNVAVMRGDWLNQMDHSEEAVEVLSRAISNARKVPFLFAALRERGRAFASLGRLQAAEEDFARATGLAPSGPHRASAAELLAKIRAQRQRQAGPTSRRRQPDGGANIEAGSTSLEAKPF